jgi:hypothetical protein
MKIPLEHIKIIVEKLLKEKSEIFTNEFYYDFYKDYLLVLEYSSKYILKTKELLQKFENDTAIDLQSAKNAQAANDAATLKTSILSIFSFLEALHVDLDKIVSNSNYSSLIVKIQSLYNKLGKTNLPNATKESINRTIESILNLLTKFINNSILKNFVNKNIASFDKNDPLTYQLMIDIFDDKKKNNLYEHMKMMENYFSFVFKNLQKVKEKIIGKEFRKEKDADVVETKDESIPKISHVMRLEKLSFKYFSMLETLFKTLDSIRIDTGEYDKKWENYNLLNARTYSKDILKRIRKLKSDPSFGKTIYKDENQYSKSLRDVLSTAEQGFASHVAAKYQLPEKGDEPLKFDFSKFLQVLYKSEKLKNIDQYSSEFKKAKKVQAILEQISKFAGSKGEPFVTGQSEMSKQLQDIHKELWDANTKTYIFDKHVRKIFYTLQLVRNVYKKQLNKILSLMEKGVDPDKFEYDSPFNQAFINEYFQKSGPIIDAFLKFLGFNKLEIRSQIVNLIAGKNLPVDFENLYGDYKANTNDKSTKALMYWNLFRRLGWVTEEAPNWMYGNVLEEDVVTPVTTSPATTSSSASAPKPATTTGTTSAKKAATSSGGPTIPGSTGPAPTIPPAPATPAPATPAPATPAPVAPENLATSKNKDNSPEQQVVQTSVDKPEPQKYENLATSKNKDNSPEQQVVQTSVDKPEPQKEEYENISESDLNKISKTIASSWTEVFAENLKKGNRRFDEQTTKNRVASRIPMKSWSIDNGYVLIEIKNSNYVFVVPVTSWPSSVSPHISSFYELEQKLEPKATPVYKTVAYIEKVNLMFPPAPGTATMGKVFI